jgi:hypothetical protein
MVTPDPERPGKRHLSYRQSIVVMALAIIVALAPWLMPLLQYK